MRKIKKAIVKVLGSPTAGKLLLKLNGGAISRDGCVFKFNGNPMLNRTAARIFFGFYESAERRMLKKHLPGNLDVIELGGSVGYISSLIHKIILKGRKHLILEPDPNFAEVAEKNISHNSDRASFTVLNFPYATHGRAFKFESGTSNVSGKLVAAECEEDTSSSRALADLIDEFTIGDFSLVMDIEGAEVMLVKDEPQSLLRCQCIIAELHSTIFEEREVPVEELEREFLHLGFERVDKDGNVYVFKRH